jgi:YgiT-type zinc finger domain-containing protein
VRTRKKDAKVKCTVCGAKLKPIVSDLPFKTTAHTIVILKDLPVLQCENCTNYLLQDDVLSRIDQILAGVGNAAELEVIRYAA